MEWSEPRPGHSFARSVTSRRTLRYGLIVIAVTALLLAYIVTVVSRANAAETLLSQGRPTTASSTRATRAATRTTTCTCAPSTDRSATSRLAKS